MTTVGTLTLAAGPQIIKYLHAKLTANQWLPLSTGLDNQCFGLLLRKSRDTYICEPETVRPVLLAAVQKINVDVAFTMSTETTNIILNALQPHQTELSLPNGELVQVIPSLADIAFASSHAVKKFQYAALIVEERLLLVWHDDMDKILHHAATVEGKLLSLVCKLARANHVSRNVLLILLPVCSDLWYVQFALHLTDGSLFCDSLHGHPRRLHAARPQ